ncbi:MAG: hypothetical protein RBT16_00540 [Desulfococcus multivorans]|jgi:hypothetical protein|nr:hypothetical protein [Desulfococcus multivorans]
MKCEKCGAEMTPEDTYDHAGSKLCEDCYMDVMTAPKACDPWAVYSATRTASQDMRLTPLQEKILKTIKVRGPLSQAQICGELAISEAEFRDNFVTLRHMALARAC